jgi:hypothetical protein
MLLAGHHRFLDGELLETQRLVLKVRHVDLLQQIGFEVRKLLLLFIA